MPRSHTKRSLEATFGLLCLFIVAVVWKVATDETAQAIERRISSSPPTDHRSW